MPVPIPRNPIRPARGLYTDLDGNKGSLYEGEICYATDQDQIYMLEGGVLVPINVQLSQSSLNDLGDVSLTNTQDGESLIYNNGSWQNGGNMDGGNF